MKTIILVFLTSITSVLTSCGSVFDESWTLQRRDYSGNELRTDGYYYIFEENLTSVYFLYRNGIILSADSYSTHDLDTVEYRMAKSSYDFTKTQNGWGIFGVKGNEIEFEWWLPILGLPSIKCKGYIENDTTIHITEWYRKDTKKTFFESEVWHFKQFSPKPDSTNNFIK